MSSHRRILLPTADSTRPLIFTDSSSGTAATSRSYSTGSNNGSRGHERRGSADSAGNDDSPKKRRTAGTVAVIACAECRKARQKYLETTHPFFDASLLPHGQSPTTDIDRAQCDGQSPTPCTRCQMRNLGCRYEPHTKTHKEFLLREIANLRKDNTRLKSINEQVSEDASDLQQRYHDLQASQQWQQIILNEIGSNGHDREIIRKLRAGETSEQIARWLSEQIPISRNMHMIPPDERSLLDIVDAFELHYRTEQRQRGQGSDATKCQWTKVSTSQTLLNHLFSLYFTWVHPIHMLFSETAFKESFDTCDDTYCCPSLVNAVCAMACHLMNTDDVDDEIDDVATLANGFMNQARREVIPAKGMPLTSVQALAVMYLAELSNGKARSACGYLRACTEYLKVIDLDEQSFDAREITLCGIQTLNTSSTGMTYQKLYAPEFQAMDLSFMQRVDLDGDRDVWRFYRTSGDHQNLPLRPSHAILTAYHQSQLFRIIHASLNLYCGLCGRATADAILTLYRRYLDWEHDLPPVLRRVDVEAQQLPHILFLHVQYHVAVIQHLEPLLRSKAFDGSSEDFIINLVIRHAKDAIGILQQSRRLYSTRYLLPLMSFCAIHVGDTLIRYSPDDPPGTQVVEFCLATLQEASAGFPICGPLQELFKRSADECGVQLPSNIEEITGNLGNYGMDDILDACTRLDYKQPIDQSVRHVDDKVEEKWANKWQQIVENPARPAPPTPPWRKGQSRGKQMRIDTMLNA
ncbi:MAG: hypothetical protein Q9203_006712 [Teloschistes exilis]